jgi:hypothetical protein
MSERGTIPAFVDQLRALQPGEHLVRESLKSHHRAILTAIAYIISARFRTKTLTGGRYRIERVS